MTLATDLHDEDTPKPPGVPRRRIRWSDAILVNGLLAFVGILFLAPLLWLLLASIDERPGWALSIPTFTMSHLVNVTRGDYLRSLLNTLYLSLIATVVATVAGALGGYALSRRRIPLRDELMVTILFLTGIPIAIVIVPVFQVFASYDLLSLVPTGVFLGATSLPFSLWLIKTAVDAVPRELEEAALVERANLLQIILHVTLPVAMPGIAAAAIFTFINAWGAFLVPLVLISDADKAPGPIMIYGLIGAAQVRYGDIAAFSIIYSLPVIALYLVCSRFFTGGFVMGGAVKG